MLFVAFFSFSILMHYLFVDFLLATLFLFVSPQLVSLEDIAVVVLLLFFKKENTMGKNGSKE